jgi:uncharacterized protein
MPKVVHGIGFPVGGSHAPSNAAITIFRESVTRLEGRWASEHLSFNVSRNTDDQSCTGFLLPPRQTSAGVDCAVRSIAKMQASLSVPFAVETGVNYLRPRSEEMNDGAFAAAVTTEANCGIVLDLHNLWTNGRNGRQSIGEFIDELPLDRVWEVHLAGGSERSGFWLDSHSSLIPEPLWDICTVVIPRLPNLAAVIFELFESWLPIVGTDAILKQLERMHELWDQRNGLPTAVPLPSGGRLQPAVDVEEVQLWEDALAAAVHGESEPHDSLIAELASDPGTQLVTSLVREFRSGMLAQSLPRTIRLLLLRLGEARTTELLTSYFTACPPRLFKVDEAAAFEHFLGEVRNDVDGLDDVLSFERAAHRATLEHQQQTVHYSSDPMPLLRALSEGRLPDPYFWPNTTPVDLVLTP